jgi:glycosyltransferase involved in cell wall biosynthesis
MSLTVLHLYNQQRSGFGGEETAIRRLVDLFESRGHTALVRSRSSRAYSDGLRGRVQAFLDGFHNPGSRRWLAGELEVIQPDVVHLHSVYPVLSPSVLQACGDLGVPVVMSVHSQVLTCPAWYHMRNGEECEKCLDGTEFWCVAHNCLGDPAKSVAYALRSAAARLRGVFRDGVAAFVTMNEFHRERLVRAGFPPERISVVRHFLPEGPPPHRGMGSFVGYAGRMSTEKGVMELVQAVASIPDVPVKLAGDGPLLDSLRARAPSNVEFLGRLEPSDLPEFYESCRFLVVPSLCSEAGPLVALEAFERACPVLASDAPGGLRELVRPEATGWTFPRGSVADLAGRIAELWARPEDCHTVGERARRRFREELSAERQYERLMSVYRSVIQSPAGSAPRSTHA